MLAQPMLDHSALFIGEPGVQPAACQRRARGGCTPHTVLLPLVLALVWPPPSLASARGAGAEGVTEAVVDVTLSLSVPGIVSQVHFQEGDTVRSNDVILELEHTIADLDCHRLKLVLENRKEDAEATRKVYENSKSISKEEVDKTELEYRVAAAEHEIACQQVALRQLRAPADGVLVDLRLDPGEASEAYQPLARLVDPRQGQFICNLDHELAARLRLGQDVELELDATGTPTRVKGRVVFLSPVVDKASSLREVKVRFDNAEDRVSLGVPGRLMLE